MSDQELAAIRDRWAKVPAPPWRWGGNLHSRYVYLSTVHNGRDFLMQFARWGTQGAQPVFRTEDVMRAIYEGGRQGWSRQDGPIVQNVKQVGMVVKEQPYRGDIEDVDNPVAQCLKHSASDVAALLAEVDRLRADLSAAPDRRAA